MHVRNGDNDYLVFVAAVHDHVGESFDDAAAQSGCDKMAAFRKVYNPLQRILYFPDEMLTQTLVLFFIPGKCLVEFDLGGSQKPHFHGLYFSKASYAETDGIVPAL